MTTFDDGDLHIDFGHREVKVRGNPVDLTPAQYAALAALTQREGQVLSYQQLFELFELGEDSREPLLHLEVKYEIVRLRRKLGWDDANQDDAPFEHVPGEFGPPVGGYRYRPMSE